MATPAGFFVYGTLLSQHIFDIPYCARFHTYCRVLSARVSGVTVLDEAGRKTLVGTQEDDAWVEGEYVTPDPLAWDMKLRQADDIEGSAYRRVVVTVHLADGTTATAYAYTTRPDTFNQLGEPTSFHKSCAVQRP